jgi:hypothetical protein
MSLVAPRRYCACVLAFRLRGHNNTVQQPRPLAADSSQVELRPNIHESSDESATLSASTYISRTVTRVWQTEGMVAQLFHWLIYCDCWSCLRFRQTPMKLAAPGVIQHPSSAWCSQCVVFSPLQPSGHYTYHQFNIQQFCVQPSVLMCEDLRINSDYFPIEH